MTQGQAGRPPSRSVQATVHRCSSPGDRADWAVERQAGRSRGAKPGLALDFSLPPPSVSLSHTHTSFHPRVLNTAHVPTRSSQGQHFPAQCLSHNLTRHLSPHSRSSQGAVRGPRWGRQPAELRLSPSSGGAGSLLTYAWTGLAARSRLSQLSRAVTGAAGQGGLVSRSHTVTDGLPGRLAGTRVVSRTLPSHSMTLQ